MTKKKILIFSLAYYPKHVGGAEVAIKEITDRISSEDIEFHMVTNRFDFTLPKVEQVGKVKVFRIGLTKENPSMSDLRKFPLHLNKFIFQFWAVWKAIQLQRRNNYDGIWAMMVHSTGVPAAIFKMFYPKVPFLLTLQEGDPIDHIESRMRPLWLFFSRAFTTADVIQPISSFLANWAINRGAKCPIEIVPNAVDTAHFSQEFSNDEIKKFQSELGKKEGDVFVVTTSRLVKKNAIDDVIKAMKFLDKNIKFIVFGTGPDEEMLKNLAKEEGVEDRVYFKGYIDHKDMPLFLKACDVFIRPSRSEGFGNSFIEAMVAEIPVVATQEGGIADFLFDEKKNPGKTTTGWAVDKNSPEQIAEAVRDIVEYSEKTEGVLANAKKMVLEKYDWNIIAKDMQKKVFGKLFK